MPRPSPAILAAMLLTGLVVAPTGVAQGIPGVPVVIEDFRPQRPAKPEPQQAKTRGELLDRVVAIVNEGVVTQSELDDAIAAYIRDEAQRGRRPPPPAQLRAPMMDYLVTREVQLQRAERLQLKVTTEEIQGELRAFAEDNKLTLSELPDAMARQGTDFTDFRDNTNKRILIAKLQQHEVLRHINVSPRELDQFIERLKKMPNEHDDYDFSDILIALPADPTRAQVEELQKEAQEVYQRAATEDFASLAITHSDARTALDGGKLVRKGSDLPSDLAEAIVALKPGEVSKPFQTANGFHVVKLNAVRRAEGDPVQDQVRVRHILLNTDAVQDDAAVRLKLAGLRQQILDGGDFGAFATSLSRDTRSAPDGGELEWYSPDAFRVEFANVVKALKENEISEPFQTDDGWHIVQVLGRRKFDTTEDALRERAFRQLRENKAEQEVELWLRQLRDETFIDTTP
jgi:peptidyl-prolyl cis-trans isomerase SurA